MKSYNQITLILLFKKRWILLISSFVVCSILGIFWAKWQIGLLNQINIESNKLYTPNNRASEFKTYAIRANLTRGGIAIANNIINEFVQNDCISGNSFYSGQQIDKMDYSLYLISMSRESSCLDDLINKLNENNVLQQTSHIPPRFELIGEYNGELNDKIKPINKHYIYLDKNRTLANKGYTITSTQIVSAHTSLNSKKIYVFVIITAILISIFLVFAVEGFCNIKTALKKRAIQ